jgi:hypothetical protein
MVTGQPRPSNRREEYNSRLASLALIVLQRLDFFLLPVWQFLIQPAAELPYQSPNGTWDDTKDEIPYNKERKAYHGDPIQPKRSLLQENPASGMLWTTKHHTT